MRHGLAFGAILFPFPKRCCSGLGLLVNQRIVLGLYPVQGFHTLQCCGWCLFCLEFSLYLQTPLDCTAALVIPSSRGWLILSEVSGECTQVVVQTPWFLFRDSLTLLLYARLRVFAGYAVLNWHPRRLLMPGAGRLHPKTGLATSSSL
uniref:Uncharacterized protein n=1 Tax=Schistocephalus solidus TaxID=70667 RepID=A0A0X3PEG1_SCHSO